LRDGPSKELPLSLSLSLLPSLSPLSSFFGFFAVFFGSFCLPAGRFFVSSPVSLPLPLLVLELEAVSLFLHFFAGEEVLPSPMSECGGWSGGWSVGVGIEDGDGVGDGVVYGDKVV
jgi:hypothetical protein